VGEQKGWHATHQMIAARAIGDLAGSPPEDQCAALGEPPSLLRLSSLAGSASQLQKD
jgi:hypothetical protein